MRKVIRIAKSPLKIEPQEKPLWICMCGLAKEQPFCDGSHKKIQEEEGRIYEYGEDGLCREV